MKRILLTSTALVAFAGAAAADVSLSGSASFSYHNSLAGVVTHSSDTEIVAAASAALDNGYTASVSITVDPEALLGDEISGGDITVANDSSSISYHVDGKGLGAAYISTGANGMMTDNNVSFGKDDPQVNESADITASMSLGGATVRASVDGSDYQIGVSTDLGGTTLDAGFDAASSKFGLELGGSTGGVDFTAGFDSDSSYGLSATTSAGGADITVNLGDLGWDLGVSVPLGTATLGATVTDTTALAGTGWEVTSSTSLDSVDLGFTIAEAEGATATTWEMTADYAADDITLGFST